MKKLLAEISNCTVCAHSLSHTPRPIVSFTEHSKILIIGQAPGSIVHQTGIPWDDKSGIRLREWMGVSEEQFYQPDNIGIVPMGFCYPGKGKTGDLRPRKECAPLWHEQILKKLINVELILLIGKYAQDYYLKNPKKNLTQNVLHFEEFLPQHFVLPHPSPRNNIWKAKNPWFEKDVLPVLNKTVQKILNPKI